MTATTAPADRIRLDPIRPSRWSAPLGWASIVLVGATVGLGLGLPRSDEQQEFSRLIAIHPPIAWASYFGVGLAAVCAVVSLVRRSAAADRACAASAEVAAVFTALTLVTGSIWGRPTWGVWWQWDPRLTTEALLMAFLLGAVALRRAVTPGRGRALVTAIFSLTTVALLPIVHFSVTWWRSLHQIGTLASPAPEENADGPFIAAMLLGFVAFTVLSIWLVLWRARVEALEEAAEGVQLEEDLRARRAEATV
jgi:heme exporter protein C